MSKYICLCGKTFKTKKMANVHIKNPETLPTIVGYITVNIPHEIFKKTLKGRFIEWFFDNFRIIFKVAGIYTIFFVLVNHFKIEFSFIESVFLAFGVGGILD